MNRNVAVWGSWTCKTCAKRDLESIAEVKIFLCFVPLGLSKWIQMGSFILEHLRSFSATWRVILRVQKKIPAGRLAGKYSLCFPALDSSTKIHLRFTSRKNLFFYIIWVPLVLDLWKCMAPPCFSAYKNALLWCGPFLRTKGLRPKITGRHFQSETPRDIMRPTRHVLSEDVFNHWNVALKHQTK